MEVIFPLCHVWLNTYLVKVGCLAIKLFRILFPLLFISPRIIIGTLWSRNYLILCFISFIYFYSSLEGKELQYIPISWNLLVEVSPFDLDKTLHLKFKKVLPHMSYLSTLTISLLVISASPPLPSYVATKVEKALDANCSVH